jgi:indolepyruvate ferredoxin oxidoreductase alpha subunit
VVTTGNAYNHVVAAIKTLGLSNELAIFKIGSYPIPCQNLREFMDSVERIMVVEELEPFIELQVHALRSTSCKPNVLGKYTGHLLKVGELSPSQVRDAIAVFMGRSIPEKPEELTLQPSPIRMCPTCPHSETFKVLKKAVQELGYDRYVAPADAGCVGLGVFSPFDAVHTNICMGSSIGIAIGLVESGIKDPVFAILGDSAFFHTGLPSLVDAVWHNVNITVIVCDNAGAAMTGLQPSPTSTSARAQPSIISIKEAASGCGVKLVQEFNPKNADRAISCIQKGIAFPGPSVLVSRSPCTKWVNQQ